MTGLPCTVAVGETVAAGQAVATIEAMKMEASITTPVAGVVERIAFAGTRQVDGGDLVVLIAESPASAGVGDG